MGFKLSNWAAMVSVTGAIILWCGSIAGMFYSFKAPAVYGFICGAFVLAFYWPVQFLGGFLGIVSNNLMNVVWMVALSIFCFFSPPTVMGGVTYLVSAIIFGIAYYNGEKNSSLAAANRV